MDSRILSYAERQVPRYTSYPTAPHFTPRVTGEIVLQWLAELRATDTLSLYLHVPYCQQLCWYCGCNTYSARRREPVQDFLGPLLCEIDLVSETLRGQRVVEIHWGGGTPNILETEQFESVVEKITDRFDTNAVAHHAIEIDPRYLDCAKARAYAKAGVNRVSLGVQDLNLHVQQAIGRVQPLEVVERAVTTLRNAGIAEIAMDLMYGLPHQGLDEIRSSVRLAASMAPNRIALFGYAHVPWFKKRQRMIPEAALPGAETRFEQAETACAELNALGYIAIGLDHFARPDDELALAAARGDLRRSFQGYVTETATAIVGLGPSAISTLPRGYAQNSSEPGAWARAINTGRLAIARGHALSNEDRIRRRLIEQIMCDFTADLAPLGGPGACADELEALAPMLADGMARLDGDRLVLSDAARPFCRVAAMAFDTYAQQAQARHSKAI